MSIETLYLVRHGHIDVGSEKRYVGQTDVALDALGMQQAQAISDFLQTRLVDTIYSSPLTRCIQTADILCLGQNLPCLVMEDLREIDLGAWEYQSVAFIKERFPQAYAQRGADIEHFVPPCGESFAMLSTRVVHAFETITRSFDKHVVIVAHAGVNRVLLAHLLGIPLSNVLTIRQPYGCVNILNFDRMRQQWQQEAMITLL
jgi:probable phosphoglycerate mutase